MRNQKQTLMAIFFIFTFSLFIQTIWADEQAQIQAEDTSQEHYRQVYEAQHKGETQLPQGGSVTFQNQEDADAYTKQYGIKEGQKVFIGQAQADAYYQELNNKRIQEATIKGEAIQVEPNGKFFGDPNAVKEAEYTEKHIVTDPNGSRHFRPNVTERTVISDRMVILPDGSTEFWKQGIDKAIQERQEALEAHRIWQDETRKKIYGDNPDAETQVLIEESKARDQRYLEEEAKRIEEFRLAGENYRKAEHERGLGVHYTISTHRKKIYGDNSNAKTQVFIEDGKVRDQRYLEEEAKRIEELKLAKEKHEKEEREKMENQEKYKPLVSFEAKKDE